MDSSNSPAVGLKTLVAAAMGSAIAASVLTCFLFFKVYLPETSEEEMQPSRRTRRSTTMGKGSLSLYPQGTLQRVPACVETNHPQDCALLEQPTPPPSSIGVAKSKQQSRAEYHELVPNGFIPHPSPMSDKRRVDPYDTRAREGYLCWDDYFMALAFLSAERSKDPNKQVGACIVDQNHVILGIGYNGFPRGCADGELPWSKKARQGGALGTKYPYVVHAEANALLNKNHQSVEGASVYVTMFPCNECAKLLIQAGIKEVVYHEGKVHEHAAGSTSSAVGSGNHMHEVELLSAGGFCSSHACAGPCCSGAHSMAGTGAYCQGSSQPCCGSNSRGGTCSSTTPRSRGSLAESRQFASPVDGIDGSVFVAVAVQPDMAQATSDGHPQISSWPQAGAAQQGSACTVGRACEGKGRGREPGLDLLASMKLLTLAGVNLRQHRLLRAIVLSPT